MVCLMLAMCVRHALDDRWLVAGLSLGVLALLDPLALGALPLVLYMFWYFQRHYPLNQLAKNTLYLLVPVGIAMGWKLSTYSHLWPVISSSALFNLIAAAKTKGLAGRSPSLTPVKPSRWFFSSRVPSRPL